MKENNILHQENNFTSNPFSSEMSGYGTFDGKILRSQHTIGSEMYQFHKNTHEYFVSHVGGENFACVAGKAVAKTGKYAFCAYSDMTSQAVAEGVCHDLFKFKSEFGLNKVTTDHKITFMSFIATFAKPEITSQMEGVEAFYNLLKHMHTHDVEKGFQWDKNVSNDIMSDDFSYSNSENAFFIPLLYPYASSEARRSDITMVVFNAHVIFEKLREMGNFDKLRQIIRGRQKTVHPHLGDYGNVNEFVQYGLVDVDDAAQGQEKEIRRRVLGECPFDHG